MRLTPRKSGLLPASGLLFVIAVAAAGTHEAEAREQATAPSIAEVFRKGTKTSVPAGKLDPGLEAIARAWRRLGVRGATQESASRNIQLDNLRVAAVIHLANVEQRPQVERALRRAWGEVVTVRDGAIYAQLPVPAIRRISRMTAVETVRLDTQLEPATGTLKETLR